MEAISEGASSHQLPQQLVQEFLEGEVGVVLNAESLHPFYPMWTALACFPSKNVIIMNISD